MSVLQNVVIISLYFHIWSGRRKLRPEDLMSEPHGLPPEPLVSLGSKRVFDPEALKPFYELKRQAESICLEKGARFLKGFAEPKDHVQNVMLRLNALKKTFDATTAGFIAHYDLVSQRWKDEYPQFAHIIEKEMLSKEQVARRLYFDYKPFTVNAVDDALAQIADDGGADLAVGLAGQLFLEISAQARELAKRSLDGRTEVTQKFLRPLRAIHSS